MSLYRLSTALVAMAASPRVRAALEFARQGAIVLLLLSCAAATPALAQDAPAAQKDTPPQVRQLLDLLADPAVRDWLQQQHAAQAAAATPAAPETTPSSLLADRVATIRQHLQMLAAALPTLPAEFERAWIILSLEFEENGIISVLLLILAFAALGYGAEWLFYWAAAGVEKWIIALPLATVGERLRAVAVRLAYGTGMVAAFAIGSVGAFLVFSWPPLLREIVLGYLFAFLIVRLTLVLGRFLFAPGGERFRIVPMSTEAARFWVRRLALFVGWLAFGWVTVSLLVTLGMAIGVRQIVAYTLGLGLLAIGLEIAWRRPRPAVAEGQAGRERLSRRASAWLLSAYAILLWLLWFASAMPVFWLAVTAVALPVLLRITGRAINHVLRPPGAADQAAEAPRMAVVAAERAARGLIIIAFALLLARGWHLDFGALTTSDTLATRLARGVLNAVVIALIADFLWHVIKAVIDRAIALSKDPAQPDTPEGRRRARLRTLLPILRNVLFIVVIVMALLMALSAMGVQIGPLIAGAGVVGVAIGFGAQTLVKDIISGVFYLLDDAFRTGEYIQSGSYKGTVESFSLRSVKLRHHRGPLFTVPFGELGAVQNMSRDWVIDKFMIGITYDSDIEKARKLIKQVGKELSDNPEFAPHILEPLKMQGVEEFGDYAIKIRIKLMTKPNQQFTIRRKAYAMIKKAFDNNGIKFAFPTVQVAGGGEAAAAAAQQALAHAQAASAD
jgi:small-conductance mechanosensitive channel